MKFLTGFIIFCHFFSLQSVTAQSYTQLTSKADSFYRSKDYINSLKLYDQALMSYEGVALDLYNAACSAALANKFERAIELLSLSIERGWTNFRHLKADTDLDSLHHLGSWTQLLSKIDNIESKYDIQLQQELLTILDDDQKIRNQYVKYIRLYGENNHQTDSIAKIILKKDSINLTKVKAIIDKNGWVDPAMVGEEASTALFLVIQHADILTQEQYLPIVREAVKKKAAKPDHLALLEDRVAIRKGKKQLYGSQIGKDEKTNKNYVYPIEDPFHVDERRERVGLGPIAEYLKNWNILWDPAKHEKETRKTN